MESGNRDEPIDQACIISIIVSFIGEKEFLDKREQKLLLILLSKMTPNTWLMGLKYIDSKTSHKIEFTSILIYNKSIPLSLIDSSIYGKTLPNVNTDFLEKILEQLENKKFDDKIRKIIKKGVQE